eukprot:bmy_13175T0
MDSGSDLRERISYSGGETDEQVTRILAVPLASPQETHFIFTLIHFSFNNEAFVIPTMEGGKKVVFRVTLPKGLWTVTKKKTDSNRATGVPNKDPALEQEGKDYVHSKHAYDTCPPPACYSPSSPIQILEDPNYFFPDFQLYPGRHEASLTVEANSSIREKVVEDPLCNFHPPNFPRISEVEMRGSEDAAAGTVLQRLIQEQLRYGTPTENMNLLAIQHQATGSAGPAHPTNNFSSTENLTQEDPQMVYQSARQEPQGQEHQVDNTVMEKQVRSTQPQQNTEELPTYEEAKAQSQFFRGQQPPPPQQQQQQGAVGHGYYMAGGASQKARTEGRPTVNRANSGQAHKDEALKELKQGHVRSLSERIMQLSLERNGAKQHLPGPGTGKGFKAGGGPSPAQPAAKVLDPRGPPPEYPFKTKQMMSPVGKTQEHGLFYSDQHPGMLHEMVKPYPAPQPARTEVAVLRYQPPPEYGYRDRHHAHRIFHILVYFFRHHYLEMKLLGGPGSPFSPDTSEDLGAH